MNPFLRSVSGCLFLLSVYCCSTNNGQYYESLASIDHILNEQPKAALDSLNELDPKLMNEGENAYYNLLSTIAQHKNNVPFSSDSLIASSREWFADKGKDRHNLARSLFYNGLVLYTLSAGDTTAYCYMRDALQLIDDGLVEDDRLAALACAYLGKINDHHTFNYAEAIRYYSKAIEYEKRLNNSRNLILNYCELLGCLMKAQQKDDAQRVLYELDSTLASNPDIRLEKPKNAKAQYYLYTNSNLDSAYYYIRSWNPSYSNLAAKYGLLSDYYRMRGQLDSAILYKKNAFDNRRLEDTMLYSTYYEHLADLYEQNGNADSAAHYAMLAYHSLRDVLERRTEKRILELEKQYDLSAREAELERARYRQNLLTVIVAALLLLTGGLVFLVRNRNRKLRAEQVTRSIIQASAKTHQNTLSQLKPLCVKRKSYTADELQSELGRITTNLRKGFTQNFSDAIEKNRQALTLRQQEILQQLSGERAKTVFLLDELGYTEEEIAEYTCTSIDSVRVTKNNIRRVVQKQD